MTRPTMERRHFELIASTIRELFAREPFPITQEELAVRFAARLRSTNPGFNRARFLTACGVEDPQ